MNLNNMCFKFYAKICFKFYTKSDILSLRYIEDELLEYYGNNSEKETFENRRLAISVNHGSHRLDVIGNIARYKIGQYSFAKDMIKLSVNLYAIIYSNEKNRERKKCQCVNM